MIFFNLLKDEHQEAKATFKRLLAAEEIDKDETVELCEKLLLHMDMEEKFFLPLNGRL